MRYPAPYFGGKNEGRQWEGGREGRARQIVRLLTRNPVTASRAAGFPPRFLCRAGGTWQTRKGAVEVGYQKYTAEMLAPVVAKSTSLAQVLRHLGVKQTGGSQANIKRRIRDFYLDTSHFLGRAVNRGTLHRGGPDKKSPDEVLILRNPLGRPEKRFRLERAMREIGIPYCCAVCGGGPHWNGRELQLEIDHVSGERFDNRRENLRFLCPNCHTQTPTYGNKNAGVAQLAEAHA